MFINPSLNAFEEVKNHFTAEMGEDLGQEFNEVVERLEHGESPEDIEASMPESAMGGDSGGDVDSLL